MARINKHHEFREFLSALSAISVVLCSTVLTISCHVRGGAGASNGETPNLLSISTMISARSSESIPSTGSSSRHPKFRLVNDPPLRRCTAMTSLSSSSAASSIYFRLVTLLIHVKRQMTAPLRGASDFSMAHTLAKASSLCNDEIEKRSESIKFGRVPSSWL
jgi:hypothetical protein